MASAVLHLRAALASRCSVPFLCLARSLATSASKRPVPPMRDPSVRPDSDNSRSSYVESIKSPQDFLKAIGRSAETKYTAESWQQFWQTDGSALRAAGVGVRDRRYILWCMEKFRQGYAVKEFAHEPPPKKTIRGWGPKVQNGKRIRSRRIKN